MEPDNHSDSDLCTSILTKFSTSTDPQHHHLCSIIGDISQSLKDLNHPLTPLAYFGATCTSLDKLLSSDPNPPSHHVDALITILSMVVPIISPAVIRKQSDYVSGLVIRVIGLHDVGDGVVVSGLKCVSHLLVVGNRTTWSDVSHLFGVVLGFVADSRLKVRRHAHVCLRDVMQGFQDTPVLSPASEAIASTFERFLLLAGGSNPNPNPKEGSRAQEVLYVLDSLKDTLPLMSIKFSTKILNYFKSLLALHQSAATRRITDALYLLCLQPTVDVSPEALVDLLCSLATSVSSNEMTGDNLTFTARLLDSGMKKVFSLNRQACVVKLPVVFSAFKDILASEHEEPLSVAMEALKSLIHTCIDESLIKQGVDQITASGSVRKSAPTIIEKLCATVESLLDYSFAAVWDMSFQVVAAMFDKLGEFSSCFLKGTLKSLDGIQKLPDEDFLYRKQLHDCVGVAVVALGPETFLKFLPLNVEAQDLSDVNVWLFPILKQNIVGARLSFFNESLLDNIKVLKLKSAKHEQEGRIHSARSLDGLAYSLWSLLPSFCNYPVDTAESFKDLEKVLCHTLREEADFRGVICSSLQILVQQNKKITKGEYEPIGKVSISQQRAVSLYTPEVATCNLDVLRSSAREILSTLSGVFVKSTKDDGGSLQRTIGEFASIADKSVVSRLFKSTMSKLLKVTQEAGKIQNTKGSSSMEIDNSSNEPSLSQTRAKLYDLGVALLPGFGTEEVDLLYAAVQPALKDTESLIQKKAYKVLSTILEHDDSFIARKFEELLKLMFEVMHSCHFSAKRHRLDCLYYLIAHVSKDESEHMKREIVASFLTEIILGLKESNKKTRNRAYEIIVQIGHACVDEDKGGNKENLYNFFNMVAGGLAGETPHMISAAVKGMARLTYEFNDLLSNAFNVLPSTFLLLQRKSREINKASLGFLKVLVAKSQAEGLQTHMRDMVEVLLSWQSSNKNHFKAKVKQLLEMLVKKCGLDAVKEAMPEEHMKLLTNIRKINERKERKHSANTEETKSRLTKATTSRLSRWNHTKIFSDFGDDDETEDMLNSKKSSIKSKRARKRLAEDSYEQLDDEPLDLLDREKTRSSLRSSDSLKRKLQADDEPEIDADGRLIISEEDKREVRTENGSDTDVRSVAASRKTEKRRKTMGQSGWAYTGSEYSSKKAGGDLKRKGKFEPYAYWPLDRKMVSRRPEHRAAARKGMSSVVKRMEGQTVSNALAMKTTKKIKKKSHKKHG
ncbi:putative armadillo-like helical protein [Helianthus annuus]|uniref:Armadillo-like helical protein n=1 Tax=Helianthus annuus TaxID=4232 RepID=A0A251U198_HELAN|nr:RRP12-like protein [Helianthus annuus]KAF5793009.1 putative armadillo-like helical protein [Helianthus annuus]